MSILGERPGIGTVANVVCIGTSTNIGIALLPMPATTTMAVRVAVMVLGVA